jgi:hypothetical protein
MSEASKPYVAAFPVGSVVRVIDVETLGQFRPPAWRFHNPLEMLQLEFAGRVTTVAAIGYYHGGDALYTLADLPGVWHEGCLETAAG